MVPHVHLRSATRKLVAAVFVIFITLAVTNSLWAIALAYDCTGPVCGGTVTWNGNVDGADARIRVGNMASTNSSSSWHINNALWVRDDYNSSACWVGGMWINTAWIEVGYIARQSNYDFYWADCRPGAGYYEFVFGPVYTADKWRNNFFEVARLSSTEFRVYIEAGQFDYAAGSFPNYMQPDQIEIGMEVIGDNSQWSDTASFNNNRYIWSGSRYYQHRDGDSKVQSGPPSSWWYTLAAPGGTGGDWRTYCSC